MAYPPGGSAVKTRDPPSLLLGRPRSSGAVAARNVEEIIKYSSFTDSHPPESSKEKDVGSPFPGMDPFLEGEMWQEFHGTLINAIRGQLMRVLPRSYVALLAKRYV